MAETIEENNLEELLGGMLTEVGSDRVRWILGKDYDPKAAEKSNYYRVEGNLFAEAGYTALKVGYLKEAQENFRGALRFFEFGGFMELAHKLIGEVKKRVREEFPQYEIEKVLGDDYEHLSHAYEGLSRLINKKFDGFTSEN